MLCSVGKGPDIRTHPRRWILVDAKFSAGNGVHGVMNWPLDEFSLRQGQSLGMHLRFSCSVRLGNRRRARRRSPCRGCRLQARIVHAFSGRCGRARHHSRRPVPMWGYGARHDRLSDGVIDRLRAKALVIEAGLEGRHCRNGPGPGADARDDGTHPRGGGARGIAQVLICGSHTHHGPVIELTDHRVSARAGSMTPWPMHGVAGPDRRSDPRG